ncbi:TPA: SGNH/GDSL hydrolase family protein [Vibrio parahaemolyticus]|uniref:SGNH/GDSL hydrolase family protein n=1 Tax=Vibrio parahaemolyticus TaxID=670 RepID=UPI00041C2220|nr:SGNH/GDSL hydrolase family protein [Vibrio parahaemolyticus]
MSSFPDLLTAFEEAVEALKVKLSQDPSLSTTYNGEFIQSIVKDIEDRWSAISAMVQGRSTFETKADLLASGEPPADKLLAEVWDDELKENNGLYGWGNGVWKKSTYDPGTRISALIPTNTTHALTGAGAFALFGSDIDNADQAAKDGVTALGFLTSQSSNIPPLEPVTDENLKSYFNADYQLTIPAGVLATDSGTANNIYLQHQLTYPLDTHPWIQAAFIVQVPAAGDQFPAFTKSFLWDPVYQPGNDEWHTADIDDRTKIVWATFQSVSTSSTLGLIGSNFGVVPGNSFSICGWGFRQMKSKPSGLMVSMLRPPFGAMGSAFNKMEQEVKSITDSLAVQREDAAFDPVDRFVNFREDDWVNAPPEQQIIPNTDAYRLSHGVSHWLKYQKGRGYSDGGAASNCYMSLGVDPEEISNKWITYVFIVRKEDASHDWPDFDTGYTWDPVQAYNITYTRVDLDEVTAMVYGSFQVLPNSESTKLLIGSRFYLPLENFYVGGWYLYINSEEPASPPEVQQSVNSRLQSIELAIDDIRGTSLRPEFDAGRVLAAYDPATWVNPPPSTAISENAEFTLSDVYGVKRWVKFEKNIGYSDGGAYNNCYLRHGVTPEDLSGKFVNYILVVRKSSELDPWPTMNKGFLWNPATSYDADVIRFDIDSLTAAFLISYQVNSNNPCNQVLVGSQFGVQSFDFYVGAWHLYITDYPLSYIPKQSVTMESRLVDLENEVARLGSGATGGVVGNSLSEHSYFALGDSITAGIGAGSDGSYAQRLNTRVAFNYFSNLAVSGCIAMPRPETGRAQLNTQINAVTNEATLITVMIGVNDWNIDSPLGDIDATMAMEYSELNQLADFSQAYRYNMETLKNKCNRARIYAILPLPTSWTALGALDEYRVVIRRVCNYLAIPVIEAHLESGIRGDDADLSPDGLHPGSTGHDILSHYIERKMTSM